MINSLSEQGLIYLSSLKSTKTAFSITPESLGTTLWISQTKHRISHTRLCDKISNASSQAAETLGEKSEQLINAEQRLMKNCQGYVRTNPITSLVIAAAAGFLVSRTSNCR